MAKVKDKNSKKRATKLKEKRLAKMKGKGRNRRPSSVKSHERKPASQKHVERNDQAQLLRQSEQRANEVQADLLVAKQHLRDFIGVNARTRSKDVKLVVERAQTFLDATAPGID